MVDNKVVGVQAVLRDITERKKAEEELQSLARFTSENPNPALRVNKDGTLLFSNKAAEMLIGEQKLAEKQHIVELFHQSVLGCLSSGLPKTVEFKFEDKTFLVEFVPVVESEYVNVYGRDVTERKKAEVSLVQEQDKLESVTAAIGAGLVIISKDYHVLWANDFIRQYKGDTIGKLCYATLNSLDAPCPDCGAAKIFAGKTTLDTHEYYSTTIDGKPYWVEIVTTPITDEKWERYISSGDCCGHN